MKKTNRFAALLLTLVMILTVIPMNAISSMAVSASDFTEPTFFVDSKYSAANSTVSVDLIIANNPGIAGATLTISFDQYLTLVSAENGEAFSKLLLTKPGSFSNPSTFLWDSESGEATDDGTILTLTFAVSSFAQADTNLNIYISCNSGDIYDENMETVNMQVVSGNVTVIDYIPGDVNGDNVINGKDVTLIRRHIVGGYNQTINAKAANVNEDGTINGKDVTAIRRYIVGGYNVELKPSKLICNHNMEAVAGKAATCTEMGNIPYWYCTECDNYFRDESGTIEISLDNTVIPAIGHTLENKAEVPATTESVGYTPGVWCSVCETWISGHEEYGPLVPNESSVVYHLNYVREENEKTGSITIKEDEYLESQTINNPYSNTYVEGVGLDLDDPEKKVSVPGYSFLGWYERPEEGAKRIYSISADQHGSQSVYAVWSKNENTAQFRSDLIPVDEVKFTVDKEKVLPVPVLSGYIFVGWSDDEGVITKTIPVGTASDKTYTANWLSERNKAWTKNSLDKPIIVEDNDNNTILFTYEIGMIENVPLYTIEDFGYINSDGVSREIEKEYTVRTEETLMDQYSKNVANATTNSSQWSLSSGWSDSVTVSENTYNETIKSETDAKTLCTTDSSNWLISSGNSGSTTTTKYDSSQDYDLHTKTGNTKTYDTTDKTDSTNRKYSAELDLSFEHKSNKLNPANIVLGNNTFKGEVDLGYEKDELDSTIKKTGDETDIGSNDQTGSIKHTGTDKSSTSSWNSSKSYGGSKSVSESNSVSKMISEKIASEYGYGKTYIKTGSETNSQGFSTSASNSDTYSSGVTYSVEEISKETIKYSTTNTKSGYHRLTKAGIAHVFAIVGYDIKSAAYFVNTFSVMDDNTYIFEDYSYKSNTYDDSQTGVISFEVPYEVEEYVLSRVGETEGLEFNSAGAVTNYSGAEKTVFIPEYHVVDNRDGTKTVNKVTSIDSNAFKNKDITGIELSEFINEIPNNAFENCTSLTLVNMSNITSIGDESFKNCTQLDYVLLSEKVESLGNNSFENIDTFVSFTNSEDVINGTINSGAKNIALFVADDGNSFNEKILNVTSETESFIFNGRGNSFNNLIINSESNNTIINNAIFNSNMSTPLKISSSEVQLGQVNVNSIGFALMLINNDCNLSLYGESKLISTLGKAFLCRNTNISKTEGASSVYSELSVDGDVYVCKNISGTSFLNCTGSIVPIEDEEYEKYLNGVSVVNFDANGGSVSESSRNIYFGQKYGALPEPIREYYDFIGWYTEENGGERITADSLFGQTEDITLYAHWSLQSFVITFDANGGSIETSSIRASCNTPIGTLPVPTRDYYTFDGWYTEATGGSKVTESYVYATPNDFTLYAHWTVNQYTYNIVYKSTNGTTLGSTTITNTYGSSSTVSAPGKTGYNTPASQTVVWDSIAKTINFLYSPQSVSTSQLCYDGKWMSYMTSKAWIEVGERTSTSVKIRIKMTNTINAGKYYGYYQWCQVSYGSTTSSKGTISNTVFYTSSDTSKQRSSTAYSGWISVPVSATTTSISVNYKLWSRQTSSDDGYFNKTGSKTVSIPTY